VSEPETGVAPEATPFLRVVRGDPTPQELAALVAVLASSSAPAPAARPVPVWNTPARMHRHVLPHGPGGWRSSALPR